MPRTQDRRQLAWLRESRAAPEFAAFVALAGPLLTVAPRGDGHGVLVLPGLGAGDGSTRPLRWFLGRLGYRTYGWGLGTNGGPEQSTVDGMRRLVDGLAERHPEGISLVGWSLGGLYAVGLARRVPAHIRQVVTLGSPLRGSPDAPPDVPVTSVYSRSDGIVPWRASLLAGMPRRENIEIRGSHIGLGHNPPVLVVVADRLAQPARDWQPFHVPRWARAWFPPFPPSS